MGKAGLKLLAAALLASVACILVATLAGPYLVKRGLQKFFVQQDGQNLGIGAMRFNPFTLSAGLDDLSLSEADGTAILKVDHVQLDFSIVSLFQQQIVLSEVLLDRSELILDLSSAAPPNSIARLIGTLSPQDGAAGGTSGIRIELGSVHRGTVHVHADAAYFEGRKVHGAGNARATAPFDFSLGELELQISQFQSGSDAAARLALTAKVNESATLRAEGQLVPASGALETSVQVTSLDLAGFGALISSNSAGVRLAGILHADGVFNQAAAGTHFSGELAISRFDVSAVSDGQPVFSAEELRVSGADISAWPLRASIRFMHLEQPRLEVALAAGVSTAGKSTDTPVLYHWLLGAFGPIVTPARGETAGSVNWLPSIDALAINGGRVSLVDPRPSEPVRIQLNQVTGRISSHAAGQPAAQGKTVSAQLSAVVGDSGPVILNSLVQLSGGQTGHGGEFEGRQEVGGARDILGVIELQQADAALFSGYFAQFAAREITSGTLNLGLSYHLKGDKLAAASRVSLKDLMLGRRTDSDSGENLPLELALALLTGPFGEVSFELPILGRAEDPAKTIATAIAGFVSAVTARPFDLLASLAGLEGGAPNEVGFEPGSAAITPAAEQQLRALGEALRQRPGLGLHVMGGHARQSDRSALARQQIQLHVALAASTRPAGRPEQAVLDFTDPKVQVVLDEFASNRLAASELAELKQRQGLNSETGASAQLPDSQVYYRKIFDALVAKEQVGDKAVRQLARYRAQSVIRQLESLGISAGRLQLSDSIKADSQPVLLEVFASAQNESDAVSE